MGFRETTLRVLVSVAGGRVRAANLRRRRRNTGRVIARLGGDIFGVLLRDGYEFFLFLILAWV